MTRAPAQTGLINGSGLTIDTFAGLMTSIISCNFRNSDILMSERSHLGGRPLADNVNLGGRLGGRFLLLTTEKRKCLGGFVDELLGEKENVSFCLMWKVSLEKGDKHPTTNPPIHSSTPNGVWLLTTHGFAISYFPFLDW